MAGAFSSNRAAQPSVQPRRAASGARVNGTLGGLIHGIETSVDGDDRCIPRGRRTVTARVHRIPNITECIRRGPSGHRCLLPAFVRGTGQDKCSVVRLLAFEQERPRRKVAQSYLRTCEPPERSHRVLPSTQSRGREEREDFAAEQDAEELLVFRASGENRKIPGWLARFQATEPPNHPFNHDAPQAARGGTARWAA